MELQSPSLDVSGQPYRGHAGIARWLHEVDEQFSEWQAQPDEIHDAGNALITIGRLHGRRRASGIESEQPYTIVINLSGEHRIMRIGIYCDLEGAREAVDVAE